jgi:hypothetical protein
MARAMRPFMNLMLQEAREMIVDPWAMRQHQPHARHDGPHAIPPLPKGKWIGIRVRDANRPLLDKHIARRVLLLLSFYPFSYAFSNPLLLAR